MIAVYFYEKEQFDLFSKSLQNLNVKIVNLDTDTRTVIDPQVIFNFVCEYYNTSYEEVVENVHCRKIKYLIPRHEVTRNALSVIHNG